MNNGTELGPFVAEGEVVRIRTSPQVCGNGSKPEKGEEPLSGWG